MTQRCDIKCADKNEVDESVQAARMAFFTWSRLSIDERKKYIFQFAKELEGHKESLAECISRETGKPSWESLLEVGAMVKKIEVSLSAHQERCAEIKENVGAAIRSTQFKPHGIMAVLGPFNLPGHLPNGQIVPALLAGNTVVFKPSEYTPMVGQRYISFWKNAGLPEGVVNLVQGDRSTGEHLSQHKDISGVLFTGSFQAGQAIHKSFAGQPEKILALEMGGNNPLIVRSNIADVQAASYMTIQSAFITSGQRCTCARRLIIEDNKESEKFLEVFIKMAGAITVGDYTDSPEPFMGPVISEKAAKDILQRWEMLVDAGGKVLLEMKCLDKGAMLSPGIIDVTDVKVREDIEIFGPLLQVIRVNNFKGALAEANNTKYGLAAGILSDNEGDYEIFYQSSKAGIVSWNRPTTGASSLAPFGGVGQSGNHRPGAYFTADTCSFPVASMKASVLELPKTLVPGITI